MDDRDQKLKKIKDEVLSLKQSPLYSYRTKNKYYPVIGEGSHHADIMFIGEAPGRNEAQTGRPFCGAAGKVLDELLGSVEINRKDVYITNIVKDRPPENRDPLPVEIGIYAPFLVRQIDIIQPKVIVTLGRFSTKYILSLFNRKESEQTISLLHGKTIQAKTSFGEVTIIPLYHPAVAMYNANTKQILKNDFQILKSYTR